MSLADYQKKILEFLINPEKNFSFSRGSRTKNIQVLSMPKKKKSKKNAHVEGQ